MSRVAAATAISLPAYQQQQLSPSSKISSSKSTTSLNGKVPQSLSRENEVYYELNNQSFSDCSPPDQQLQHQHYSPSTGRVKPQENLRNVPVQIQVKSANHQVIPQILCSRVWRGSLEEHNAPLTAVCLDERCLDSQRFMICGICSEEDHGHHEKVLLSTLVEDMKQLVASKSNTRAGGQEDVVMRKKNEALLMLRQILQSVTQAINLLDRQVSEFYDSLALNASQNFSFLSADPMLASLSGMKRCQNEGQIREKVQELMRISHEMCNETIASSPTLLQDNSETEGKDEVLKNILARLHMNVQDVFAKKSTLITHVSVKREQNSRNISTHSHSNGNNHSAPLTVSQAQIENISNLKNTVYDPMKMSQHDLSLHQRSIVDHSNNNSYSQPNEEQCDETTTHVTTANSRFDETLKEVGANQRMEFSKTMKDPNIQLQFRQIVNGNYQKNNGKLHYRVQLAQPELEGVTPIVRTWSFKITRQQPHWLAFGMCHINDIRQKQYKYLNNEFSFQNEEGGKRDSNHGCYLLTTHGWVFANGKQPRRTNMRYTKSDVVNCKFDPLKKLLIFAKNGETTTEVAVEFEPICWNKLYPCVVMWYPEDSVELLC